MRRICYVENQVNNICMENKNVYLYARKSTEEDDRQVMSIEAQLAELREFARDRGLEILGEYTEAKSAKKPGNQRLS